MNLAWVNDPDFELSQDGWCIRSNGESIIADIMVDSVLDSPKIKSVCSSIIKKLLENDIIEAVHDDLGVSTNKDGYIKSTNVDREIPIALLGRLAKGTIIGVDAILECYGTRAQHWASKAARRHINWMDHADQ